MPPFKLAKVIRVEFYKRDELTTDLICCDITTPAGVISAHEEMPYWEELIRKLEFLGGFDVEWFSQVSKPAFAASNYVAFQRPGQSVAA